METGLLVPGTPEPAPARRSLRKRVGVHRGNELLTATTLDGRTPTLEERVRGIERLAADGSKEAIDALVEAMAEGTPIFTNLRTRLVAVRALARFAGRKEVRGVLVRTLGGGAGGGRDEGEGGSDNPLEDMTRATAALALARAGTRETVNALLSKVLDRRASGDLARTALLSYPPRSLEPLLKMFERKTTSQVSFEHRVVMLELLGDLGDPRAIPVMRRVLRESHDALAEAAVVALAKLGDSSAAPRARAWLSSKKTSRSARLAATEALLWLDAPDAPRAIAALLGEAAMRSVAFDLAERSLSPALAGTLEAIARAPLAQTERLRAAALLGRIGGPVASRALVKLLAVPELATSAAFGLARSEGDIAVEGLSGALAAAPRGPARRLVMRAAIARYLLRGETIAGLEGALEEALRGDDADRAVAAFGLAILGKRSIAELVESGKPEQMHAAARAALALGEDALLELRKVKTNTSEEPDAAAVAAGVALLVDAEHVSTQRLAGWAEGGGPLAPLAAMRLAMRDSLEYRSRLERLLDGTDPVVRVHVALGLAASPERDAVSLLADAYRFEPDAQVRRALVRALSQRSEVRRRATLALARDLDPDPGVRALARSALNGRRLAVTIPPAGRQVAWVMVRANSEAERKSVASRPAALVRPDGLALPVVADPDGGLLVPGLEDAGKLSLRLGALALERPSRQPSRNVRAKRR